MLSSVEIALLKGGTAYDLIYDKVDILHSAYYDSTNWSDGQFTNTSFGTQLVAVDATGGSWVTAIPVPPLADVINSGVHLSYEGAGVTMAYSLDGTSWTTTTNKTTVLEGTSLIGAIFFVRLTLANDTSYVDSLTVDIIQDRTMMPAAGVRELTFSNTAMDHTPVIQTSLGTDDGADIALGGYIEIAPDTSATPTTTKTIEFWLKKNGAQNSVVMDASGQQITINNTVLSFTGMTVKINGASATSGTTTVALNTWVFVQAVLTTASNSTIRFGSTLAGASPSDINIYGLALYTDVPTGTYEANTVGIGTRIIDTAVMTVTESNPAVDIYAYTWTPSGT